LKNQSNNVIFPSSKHTQNIVVEYNLFRSYILFPKLF
jgi:hypothetical protein